MDNGDDYSYGNNVDYGAGDCSDDSDDDEHMIMIMIV